MNAEQSPDARRTQAINQWLDAVFAMYPLENTGFMRTREDRFANPVGHALRQAAEALYDAVTGADTEREAINAALAAIRLLARFFCSSPFCANFFWWTPWLPATFGATWIWSPAWTRWRSWRSICMWPIAKRCMPNGSLSSAGARRSCGAGPNGTAWSPRWGRHPLRAMSPDCSSGAPLHARSPERGVPAHSRRLPRRAGAAAGDGFLGGIRNPGTR